MKNFSTRKRLSAPVAPTLAVMAALLSSACDRDERPVSSSTGPEVAKTTVHDISARNIAKMLAELPMTLTQAREVYQGVCSSSSNGYDEEYPFSNLVTCPGTGVGDDLLQTRSKAEHSEPLRDLLLSAVGEDPVTRAGTFLDALSDSGLQIYWPYSEDWDGETMPVITFDPAESRACPISAAEKDSNIGYLRESLPNGVAIVKEILVDEEYARTHPVWVINRNEDSAYLTPQMVAALYPERNVPAATRAHDDCRTLVLKEFKAHRNYDSWFAGASEFFVKCGALDGFTAKTEEEIKLYSPSVTDMMINVKRKHVGSTLRFNTVIVSEWTSQLEECAFLVIEDDGGKQTSWKASGVVKIKSRSYGFEVDLPFRRNDDLVWRGKLSSKYFEKNNGKPNRFGDVSVTFSFL